MLISLSEIMTKEDKVERIQVPIEMDKFEFQGVNYEFAEKNLVELKITNIGKKKVLLEGKLSIALKLLCDRCLEDVEFPMNIDIFKELDFNETDIEDEETESLEEISYIIRYDLDVDILVYNEIIVRFPMKVVCDEECKVYVEVVVLILTNKPVTVILQYMILEWQQSKISLTIIRRCNYGYCS